MVQPLGARRNFSARGCIASFLLLHLVGVGIFHLVEVELGSTLPDTIAAGVDPPRDNFHPRLVTEFDLDLSAEHNTPACARDVFIALRETRVGASRGVHACRGLLLLDDLLLTSKACANLTSIFEFEGAVPVRTVPHALNAASGMVGSPLGFLEAVHPPTHHVFDGRPVRRARMFLSRRSDPLVQSDKGSAAFMTCGDDNKPIAHNFPVDGAMVSLQHLSQIVPEDVLWEETDGDVALMLTEKSHRWWTRPITLKEEEETFRIFFSEWEGPPGSLSLTAAHDDFVVKVGALAEAVDPRGHRYSKVWCFKNYYIEYRRQEPFSRLHFFDWLDFGPGATLFAQNDETFGTRNSGILFNQGENKICHKGTFDHPRQRVHYFNEEEKSQHEIYIEPFEGGRLIARYRHNDNPVPKSKGGGHLYMWDLNQKLYVVNDAQNGTRYGGTAEVKHSSVVAGGPALAAGDIHTRRNGNIRRIGFNSGHYYTGIKSVIMIYQWMKNQGLNVSAIRWIGRESWFNYPGGGNDTTIRTRREVCSKYDWASVQISGYDSAQLKEACCEVTTSPSWLFQVEK